MFFTISSRCSTVCPSLSVSYPASAAARGCTALLRGPAAAAPPLCRRCHVLPAAGAWALQGRANGRAQELVVGCPEVWGALVGQRTPHEADEQTAAAAGGMAAATWRCERDAGRVQGGRGRLSADLLPARAHARLSWTG